MDYEKKYKEAVGRAKKLIETSVAYDRFTIEKIFPELKEFDSEKIRGAIIHFISHTPTVPKGIIGKETMITWLEEQGKKQQKTLTWKHWSGNGIAGNGEGKLIYLVKEYYTYSLSSCLSFECDYIELSELDKLLSEKHIDKAEQKDYSSIDPNFFKPVDKIEPKFHEGDWIVHQGTENIYQVVTIIDNQYQLKCGNIYTVQKCADVDRCARLWTIDDAKDGSILACENGWTCIFKALDNHTNTFSSYCFMDADGWFYEDGGEGHTLDNRFCGEIHPATEERRDKFEKAMANAEYEWNAEKKELNKIEQKPTDEEMRELLRTEYEKGRADTIAEMQVTWSEEDENYIFNITHFLEHPTLLGKSNEHIVIEMVNWLKSLKQRIGD